MAQLSQKRMNKTWSKISDRITVLVHVLNRSREMERLLKSVAWADRICVLIDDRTTDNVKEICEKYGAEIDYFTWCDDFSYPKNILTKKVPHGEWCLVVGSDFELPKETGILVRDFIKDPLNCLGKFNVKEYVEDPEQARQRMRVLLWRSHPKIYWERLAHEEMKMSAFRLTYIGIAFKKEWAIPCLADMYHYGDFENTPEELERKQFYYHGLFETDITMRESNMSGSFGLLYASLRKFKVITIDGEEYVKRSDIKDFMDGCMEPGFKSSKYGSVYTDEEIQYAMHSLKLPTNIVVDRDYD